MNQQRSEESQVEQQWDQEQVSHEFDTENNSNELDRHDSENELESSETIEKKRKWKPFVFEEPLPPLEAFDLHPVNDIVVRNAVDDGVKNKRDLSLYKTTDEWNGYPPGMVIVASEVAAGQSFAVWDPPKRKKTEKAKKEELDETSQEPEEKIVEE